VSAYDLSSQDERQEKQPHSINQLEQCRSQIMSTRFSVIKWFYRRKVMTKLQRELIIVFLIAAMMLVCITIIYD
jgi:maltodextrin utilization protein YvdJ